MGLCMKRERKRVAKGIFVVGGAVYVERTAGGRV